MCLRFSVDPVFFRVRLSLKPLDLSFLGFLFSKILDLSVISLDPVFLETLCFKEPRSSSCSSDLKFSGELELMKALDSLISLSYSLRIFRFTCFN